MRFTKIPLIATLMAVALSLLIVLPTLAQQTTDITDGKQGNGVISVGVFDDIADAQMGKLTRSTFPFPTTPVDLTPPDEKHPYIPTDTPTNISGGTLGQVDASHAAYLADRRVDPQNTFFRGVLYVSNDNVNDEADIDPVAADNQRNTEEGAYNTVLINVQHPAAADAANNTWAQDCVLIDADGDNTVDDPGPDATVTAVVRNNRSTRSITIELAVAAAGDTDAVLADRTAGRNAQGFFKVVPDDGVNLPDDGPVLCGAPGVDGNNDGDFEDEEDTAAEETVASATDDTIAQIPARHGDRLVITVPGQSGQIEITVDGEGPDFSAISPDDNAVSRSSRLAYSFEVRDDDSGLRHDGESVVSQDGDLAEINPDGDQILSSEPLSVDPNTAVPANGRAADINVNVADNPKSPGQEPTPAAYTDISASGEWRMAGSRAGVAYSFNASGADKGDGDYLYQLEARDRAGNWTVTDGDDSTEGANEPFVFRVDDTDPALAEARTGIAWDADKNREKVDRSYIALEFRGSGADGRADALGDVDTNNITVVGYTIVGFTRPNRAPAIDRNVGIPKRSAYPPEYVRYTPVEPTSSQPSEAEPGSAEETAWNTATASTDANRTADDVALLLLEGRWDKYNADVEAISTFLDSTPDADVPAPVGNIGGDTEKPAECDEPLDFTASSDVEECGQWDQYALDLAQHTAGVEAEAAAEKDWEEAVDEHNAAKTPGTAITADGDDNLIGEPRSRVYIELSEDLPSDARPDVVVVGGAVYDLAGNTNEADTIEATDWIAPGLTVTVTGTANDRPVANDDGSFEIDVRSDEDLARRPKVYLVSVAPTVLNDDEDGYKYEVATVSEANSITQQEDDNHWAKSYKVDSPDFDAFSNQLVGVIVLADDERDNSGATDGWSPGQHRKAAGPKALVEPATEADDRVSGDSIDVGDLDDAGLLIELDDQFNGNEDPVGTVTPRSDTDGGETESANPFVRLSFSAEDGEYDACPATADDGTGGCASGADAVEDSHDTVTVTEIMLNGEDVLGNLNRVNATDFSLVTRDLAVDTHEVTYTAVDDAGNEYEGEFEFDVKERAPYEIKVSPGWNLISLPATPIEPAIDAVLANNQYISPVLGYQEGDWITAVREEDGTWRGRLTDIVGGYGYWVHARTFESINTMLSEVDPAGTLPTVPVTAGWNLLGVLDVFQNDANAAPGETIPDPNGDEPTVGDGEADNYFNSIPWRVAYAYNTTHSQWEKTVPDVNDNADKEVLNGRGYWVWSPTPGTLVP